MGRKEDFRVCVGGESDLTPFSCSKKETKQDTSQHQHAGEIWACVILFFRPNAADSNQAELILPLNVGTGYFECVCVAYSCVHACAQCFDIIIAGLFEK